MVKNCGSHKLIRTPRSRKKMYKWKQKKGRKMDPEIDRGTHKLSLIPYFKKKWKENFSDSNFPKLGF